jgi:hypothetical protein
LLSKKNGRVPAVNVILSDPMSKARFAELGASLLPGSPARFWKARRRRDREVGQGGQILRRKGGLIH